MRDRAPSKAAGQFPVTRWSVVAAARSEDSGTSGAALEVLSAAYWRPVYKYIRLRWNRATEDAQDLTQSFFSELLQRKLLDRYQPDKSRLRTYLRLCVDSFVMNEDKAARRQKRGGGATHLALDTEAADAELTGLAIDPATLASPETLDGFFEKEWIRGLFSLALEELQEFCKEAGHERDYLLFDEYDLSGDSDVSYSQLAERHAMRTSDVTNALAWARRQFRRIALEKLRAVCNNDEEFQREALAIFGWSPE